MVRSDLFQAMDSMLRNATRSDLPFGGKQIIVVGDFCQLSPVIESEAIEEYLRNTFGGIFAFQTKAWNEAGFKEVKLDSIHRQNDREFVNLLGDVRRGVDRYWGERVMGEKFGEDYTYEDKISIFEDINQHCCRPLDPDSVAVCCKRRSADQINASYLEQLEDSGMCFPAVRTGCFPDHELPTEFYLNIKRGARVMLLSNKPKNDGSFQYVNGDIGTVLDYGECNGKPQVTVQLALRSIP
jgi:superfamily I DNA and/or RNA helicase